MLAISSASVVDGYFVGNYVGASGLAAVNISMPVFSLFFGLSLMLSVGSSVISGKLIAESKTADASVMFSKTVLTMTLLSLILTSLVYLNMQHILKLFGASGELLLIASNYLSYILYFLPFLMVGIVLDYYVKIDNRPMLAFGALLLSAVLNIVLDWLLIVSFDMGIEGAALATGISQLALILVLLPHFFTKEATIRFVKPAGSWLKILQAGANGASEFVNEMSIGVTTIIFNYIMIKSFGVDGVAAYTVVSYVLWISVMISFGISDSLQPLISKNYGAKNYKRIGGFVKYALLSVSGVGLALLLTVVLIPEFISFLFLDEKEIASIKIVLLFLSFIWPAFLFNGANMVISAYFTATHQPIPSATIALSRSFLLPILFVLLLPLLFGDSGIYMAIPAAEFFTLIIAVYFFIRFSKKKL